MADLRPALQGWAKIAPDCVENARKGFPFLALFALSGTILDPTQLRVLNLNRPYPCGAPTASFSFCNI